MIPPIELKFHKLFKGFPTYLKDPKNYYKVRKLLLDILSVPHSHSELIKWSNCTKCQENVHNLNKARKKLGFKSAAQYYAWQKIMDYIHNPKSSPIKPVKPIELTKDQYKR